MELNQSLDVNMENADEINEVEAVVSAAETGFEPEADCEPEVRLNSDACSIFSSQTQPLGCCSNCFRRLPREPTPGSPVMTEVKLTNPDTGGRVTLSLLEAIRYMFKDKSAPAPAMSPSAELSFCVSCGPIFKHLLSTFNAFTERSAVDSGVYKFLVDRSVLPVSVKVEAEDGDVLNDDLDDDDDEPYFPPPIVRMKKPRGRRPKASRLPKREKKWPELEPPDSNDYDDDESEFTLPLEVNLKVKKPRKSVRDRVEERKERLKTEGPPKPRTKRIYMRWKDGEGPRLRVRNKPTGDPAKPKKKVISMEEADAEFYKTGEDGSVIVKCISCEETFDGVFNWAEHQASAHAKDVGWIVTTPLPPPPKGKSRPGRRLPCPECWKPIRTFQLRDHVEGIHKGNLPIICSDCGKGFVNEALLKVHSRNHNKTGEKSHLCLLCGAGFLEKNSLKRHELCHTQELKKRHKCDECGAAFETPTRLAAHKWTHIPMAERPKPFTCPDCDMCFESKRRLNGHLYNHKKSAKRESKCGLCDKEYTRNSGLKEHLMVAHKLTEPAAKAMIGMRNNAVPIIMPGEEIRLPPQKPQKPRPTCNICAKKYSRREYLTSHLISAHGKTEEEAKSITGLETKRVLPSLPSSTPTPKRSRKSLVIPHIDSGSESSRNGSESCPSQLGPPPMLDLPPQAAPLHLGMGFTNSNPYQPFPAHHMNSQWGVDNYHQYPFSRH